jgi:hypothetical protein
MVDNVFLPNNNLNHQYQKEPTLERKLEKGNDAWQDKKRWLHGLEF